MAKIEHPIITYIRDAIAALELLPDSDAKRDLEDKLNEALVAARFAIDGGA
ncbi:hypothetical protein [Agrobacterium sp. 10MFCol1.1]|uniref:hypothetical protein n=1 Tax=Agrobacterium sp. 10MFCol1.1 TaxID=1150775 RepID=UPI000378E9C1|nr:hypothetical protein [Agrobacterium sp. 10MFCol1.1]